MFNIFGFMADYDNYEQRKVGKTEVNGLQVSTAYSSDEGYETALIDADGVHPVERYKSKEDAVSGHEKWCKKAKKIKTCTKLGWGGLVDDTEITLQRMN